MFTHVLFFITTQTKRLLYRDLKPENIGFDIRGDVKLFDFGLCKSLEEQDRAVSSSSSSSSKPYGYNLTAKTGSIPYMAPEVALGKPYALEADVFSFGILLWEILTLNWAFNGYSRMDYFVRVVKENERLNLPPSLPSTIRAVIPEAWDKDPQKRPNIRRIGALLRGELEDISVDSSVLNRTFHMVNRSARSQHLVTIPNLDNNNNSLNRNRSRLNSSSHRRSREDFVGSNSTHG